MNRDAITYFFNELFVLLLLFLVFIFVLTNNNLYVLLTRLRSLIIKFGMIKQYYLHEILYTENFSIGHVRVSYLPYS